MTLAARVVRIVLAAMLFAVATAPANAAVALHGVVLDVLAAQGELIVRHEPFGGMPAMTMLFRVAPAATAAKLHPGDRIDARVDESGDPWTLGDVRVVGEQSPTAPHAVHNVAPLVVGDALPRTEFFDQNGRAFDFSDFRGQTVVLSFVYTRCRDPRMCPLISSSFHVLQNELAGLPVHLVEITLDPAFDTPPVLTRYGRRFDADPARWTFGTGPVDVVSDFAARFGIAVFDDPSAGLIHTDRTAIVDRNGVITDLLTAVAWNPADVAAEVRAVSRLPSNLFERIDFELSKASAAICGNSLPGYSGLLELMLVIAIFAGASWLLYRIARKIFIEEA